MTKCDTNNTTQKMQYKNEKGEGGVKEMEEK